MGEIDGRQVLITGGASGIGAGLARRFAAEGGQVVVADLDDERGEAVANEVGGQFRFLDVADPAGWAELVDHLPALDIVALNAGVVTSPDREVDPVEGDVPLIHLGDADYRRAMGVNVDGVVFGVRAVLPGMVARRRGDILVTASLASVAPIPPDPIYTLGKHAVAGLVRSVALTIEPHGVCISALCPGFVDTPIISERGRAGIAEMGLAMLQPDDVADVAMHAVQERHHGALWTIWPGLPPQIYQWAPPVEMG